MIEVKSLGRRRPRMGRFILFTGPEKPAFRIWASLAARSRRGFLAVTLLITGGELLDFHWAQAGRMLTSGSTAR
jgi:hypothetical protein